MELWKQIRGNAKWDFIKEVLRYGGPVMIPFLYAAWQEIHDRPFDYSVLAVLALMGLLCTLYAIKASRKQPLSEPSAVELPGSPLMPSVSSAPDRTELEIRFHSEFEETRSYSEHPFYRIGIYNRGTQVARGVEVLVESLSGFGVDRVIFQQPLPQRLKTQEGNESRCDINPAREEVFQFVQSYRAEPETKPENARVGFDIVGIPVDPQRNKDSPEHLVLRFRAHMRIHVKVYCANADSRAAIFCAECVYDVIDVSRIC